MATEQPAQPPETDSTDSNSKTSPPASPVSSHPAFVWAGAHGGELNYIVGVSALSCYQAYEKVPTKSQIALTVGWNWLDAVFALVAAKTIYDKRTFNYRYQSHDKWKVGLNIFAAIELLLFSWKIPLIPFPSSFSIATPLAGIAFAISMFVDFINASIDYKLERKKATFFGWLEETEKEITFLVEAIQKQEALGKNVDEGKKRLDVLLDEFNIRCEANYTAADTPNKHKIIETIKKLKKLDPPLTLFDSEKFTSPSKETLQREKEIREQLITSEFNWGFKAASFVGMSLLAVPASLGLSKGMPDITGTKISACSPLFFGTILVACVALFYFARFLREAAGNDAKADASPAMALK